MTRVMLAERFGWQLDYVDSLSYQDVMDIYAVIDAQQKARKQRIQ